jgi:hypothetical protein
LAGSARAIYLFVMAGGYTAGSIFRGRIADSWGIRTALATAGAACWPTH